MWAEGVDDIELLVVFALEHHQLEAECLEGMRFAITELFTQPQAVPTAGKTFALVAHDDVRLLVGQVAHKDLQSFLLFAG
ncbi:hypothetical protein D3C84_1141890 [compost metagenome]